MKNLGVKVLFKGELFDENGKLKKVNYKHNMIVNSGFDFICDALAKSIRPPAMEYVAIGSGAVETEARMVRLNSELSRVKGVYSHSVGTKFFTLKAEFRPGVGTGEIRELGIFNALSGGTMFDRVVLGAVTKNDGDTYKATFQFSIEETV